MSIVLAELDAATTADEVADILTRAGIRGDQYLSRSCPLARAVGEPVTGGWTTATLDFVLAFDAGMYPHLRLGWTP